MPLNRISWVREEEAPLRPPPRRETGAVGWIRANLLSTPLNAALTVLSLLVVALLVPSTIEWAFIDAVWTGESREDCIVPDAGACWAYVKAKLPQFIFGRYPVDERWRVVLTFVLLAVGLFAIAVPGIPGKRYTAVYLLAVFPVVAFILLTGGNLDISARAVAAVLVVGCAAAAGVAMLSAGPSSPLLGGILAPAAAAAVVVLTAALFIFPDPAVELFGFPVGAFELGILASAAVALLASLGAVLLAPGMPGLRSLLGIGMAVLAVLVLFGVVAIDYGLPFVETPLWGGLLVTLVVAIVGIVASLPLGVLLALGRRSQLPVIRLLSIVFIEFWRGVPLITVLFMASVMLPIFLPPGVNFDKLLRALIGVALFSAAYMAEVVRGGLQAIPRGQYEGAMALGLGYWQRMRLVILPQALTLVIPGIVNSFIALFKDTSLVLIIGIMDLLGIIQSNNADANWASPATPATGYAFAALVYWVFCFSMSRYSLYTERRLGTGFRRR